MDKNATDIRLRDVHEGTQLIVARLSIRAQDRYNQSLWYSWGREDAGDSVLHDMPNHTHNVSNHFAFAAFCALEAESYEREYTWHLSSVTDQYRRFVAIR